MLFIHQIIALFMFEISLGWCEGLGHLPFEKVLEWAKKINIETLELNGSPKNPHTDVDKILSGQRGEIKGLLDKYGIKAATMVYCTNHLDPNKHAQKERYDHMLKVIDAAHALEIPIVSCFIGNSGGPFFEQMGSVEANFLPILEHAKEYDIKMAIENCPGGNIANNPLVWDTIIFEVANEFDNLGLEFDPSHLVWLQVDWADALREFLEKKKVFCCHAKDTIIFPDILKRGGFQSTKESWWHYKIPGKGLVDWHKFMQILADGEFKGAVQIEHEDPEYSGSKYQEGVELGIKTLSEARKAIKR